MNENDFYEALETVKIGTLPSILTALQVAKKEPTTKWDFIKLLSVTQTPAINILNKLRSAKVIKLRTDESGKEIVEVLWLPSTQVDSQPVGWTARRTGNVFTLDRIKAQFAAFNEFVKEHHEQSEYVEWCNNNLDRINDFWAD